GVFCINDADASMQRVGRMKIEGARAGAGHGGGNFLRNYSRLTHSHDHDFAFAGGEQLHDSIDFVALQTPGRLSNRFRFKTQKALNFGKIVFVSHSLPLIYDHPRLLQVYSGHHKVYGLESLPSQLTWERQPGALDFRFISDDIQIDNLRSLGYSAHSSNAN